MVVLTSLQSISLFGLWNPRPILSWSDVLRLNLSLDRLISTGMRASSLALVQPDPAEWVAHAGAGLAHARFMMYWPANPFTHLNADLADVLLLKLTAAELLRMEVNHAQLVLHGMTPNMEGMFKFDADEWALLGR